MQNINDIMNSLQERWHDQTTHHHSTTRIHRRSTVEMTHVFRVWRAVLANARDRVQTYLHVRESHGETAGLNGVLNEG